MAETYAQQFATVFAPSALEANLPLRLVRDFPEELACSLGCAAVLFDRSLAQWGPGVSIELADPFATHDQYCAHCGKRIS